MESTPVVTAESAAIDAANAAVETVTPQPAATTEKKATDVFGEIEQDIKNQFRSEKAQAQPGDESGKFAKPEGDAPEPVDVAEPDATGDAAPPDAQPEEKPAKTYVAEFTVADDQGEIEIPDLKLTFKANGKDLKDVPLDRVVKLAQWGAYNEEREATVRQTREESATLAQQNTELQQQIAAFSTAYEQLLSDPEFYQDTQAKYLEAHTPEAQLQRLRSEREEEARRREIDAQETQVQAQATQFVQYLAPKLETLVTQNPLVSFDEVFGRYNLLTAPLLVGGRIPPQNFMQVDQLVDTELTQYAAALNAERSTKQKQATAQVADAKRQMARAVAPKGTPPVSQPKAQPTNKPYAKATDILADLPNLVRVNP